MTTESYITAWVFYVLGGVGLFAFWCWLTQSLRHPSARLVARVLMLVLIMFPFNIGDGYQELAPGVLMLALEAVFEGGDAFLRVGTPLLMALLVTLLVTLVAIWLLERRRRRQAEQAALSGVHDELLEESQQQAAEQVATQSGRREPTL